MMDKRTLWSIIYKQLRDDFNASVAQLVRKEVSIVPYEEQSARRQYHEKSYPLRGVSLPAGGVLSVAPSMVEEFEKAFEGMESSVIFNAPHLRKMEGILRKHGHQIEEMHHVFLPEKPIPLIEVDFSTRWFGKEDLEEFRGDKRFPNALTFQPNCPDEIAVAAVVRGEIVGLAGASSDCEDLWQIGVDVLPQHGGRQIAMGLVTLLRQRVEEMEKVPIYGTCTSHIISQKIAVSCGFTPGWVELYAQ